VVVVEGGGGGSHRCTSLVWWWVGGGGGPGDVRAAHRPPRGGRRVHAAIFLVPEHQLDEC